MNDSTILLVEDEAGIRELITLYLENRNYTILQAENGEQALRIVKEKKADLVLLDIEMPGIDGFDVCKKIRERLDIPIIFISGRKGVVDKIKSFEVGGDDFITKPFDLAELEARVKSNVRRYNELKNRIMSSILKYGDLEINVDTYDCFLKGDKVTLSAKEMQLLLLLVKRPDQVFSAEQLYDSIWGIESTGDSQTVKVHIRNLRRKIEVNPSKPNYIQTVRGFGYRFSSKIS